MKVDGGTFSIKEVSNSRTLMSMTTGAVITLDSLGSNTVLNTTGSVVVPNGSVGIGTSSPTSVLQVKKNSATSDILIESDTLALLQLKDTDLDKTYNVEIGRSASAGDLTFRSATGEKVRFTEAGLVGIGTSSPSSYDSNADDLVIASTGNTGITIAGGTTGASSIYFADGTSGGARS